MSRRDAIQRIALEFCSYGRPRIPAELKRRGWEVNHKRVHRILREDNLRCLRRRKFVVPTDSGHDLRVYPNLARQMVRSDGDQLWRADITYVRLQEEFVLLAVILDAYSRRVIGGAWDRTLQSGWALAALRMALSRRGMGPGLGPHSDRGVPYASRDYPDLLQSQGIRIRMSRQGNPWDNAAWESFMKTLQYAEVYRSEYRDWAEARSSSGQFLERIYHRKRLHSALGYVPPVEFAAHRAAQKNKAAAARRLSL
jgi:transposase InsO family protein